MQDGTPVLVTRQGTTFQDPSQRYSIEEFPCRSTLVKLQDGTWDCVEHREVYTHRRMVNFDVNLVQVPTTVVTLIHREGEQQVPQQPLHQGEEVQQGQQEQEAPERIQDLPEQPLQLRRNVEQPDTHTTRT